MTFFILFGACMFAAEPQPPQRSIPSAQTLIGMVPTTGELGERELTLLAIARRPELERLRGTVKVASAQQLAAHDLVNPELRLSYAYDNDALVREPTIEHEIYNLNSNGPYDTLTSTDTLNGTLGRHEQGTINENRTRMIERQVTPGRTQDVIEERIYDVDNTRTTTSRERTKLGTTSPESETQFDQRHLVTTTRRVINHPDTMVEDTKLAAFIRFTLPHPWERRARIQRAAAEVTLAQSDYFAGEDIIVRTVRASVQQLALLEAKLATQQKRKADSETYRDWLEKQPSARIGLDLAASRARTYGTLNGIRTLEGEVATVRQDLASYCGVTGVNRIGASLSARRIVDPSSLDIAYLANFATLYRTDMLNVRARLAVAGAQLSEAKAASIPFTTFLDLGYTHETTTHRIGDSNEFVARIGISFPIFDWTGFNKKREVPKAATLTLNQQINMQRSLITNEVKQAITRLITADTQLGNCDKDLTSLRADLKKSQSDTQMASAAVTDVIKARQIEQEFADVAQQMELTRFASLAAYQDALMALEKAVGIRIEHVLRRGVDAP